MGTFRLVALIAVAAMLMTGCVYSNIKTPLDRDLDKTEMGTKVGQASMYSVLWMVSWGDSSTAAAAKDGKMSTVNHMDMQVFSVLFGMYTRTTTIAYGD
jgi:hypothetical protein